MQRDDGEQRLAGGPRRRGRAAATGLVALLVVCSMVGVSVGAVAPSSAPLASSGATLAEAAPSSPPAVAGDVVLSPHEEHGGDDDGRANASERAENDAGERTFIGDLPSLTVDAESTYDTGSRPEAEAFDRTVETNTAAGSFTPEPGLDPAVLDTGADRVHVLVQFDFDDPAVSAGDAPTTLGNRYDLVACGSYLDTDSGAKNAHCYGIPTGQVEAFASEPRVVSVSAVDAELKRFPDLRRLLTETDERPRLAVELYPDADPSAWAASAPVEVTSVTDRRFATAPVGSFGVVEDLATSESVQWVSFVRPVETHVDEGREHVGADHVSGTWNRPGVVTGEGVFVVVLDSGIRADHHHFNRTTVVFSQDYADGSQPPEDEDGHGTHVAGTIAGNGTDPRSGDRLLGVAPDADLVVGRVLGETAQWAASLPFHPNKRFDDLLADAPGPVPVISNSWGVDDMSRISPVSRYGYEARTVDTWAFQHPDTLLVFSNGNACEDDPDERVDEIGCSNYVGSPALGKNVLAVGATHKNGNASLLNDLGPPEDVADGKTGRLKPDVLAPGESIRAPLPGAPDQYGTLSGTSMAAPHVSGVVALVEQADPSLDANGVKALLVGTTTPVKNPHGVLAGHGEVNAYDAVYENDFESLQRTFDGAVAHEGRDTFHVDVREDDHRIDATVAWQDPAKTAGGTSGILYNNIHLVLVSPSGQRYTRTDVDNVKKLSVMNPEQGRWKLHVEGHNVGPALRTAKWRRHNAFQDYDGVVRVVSEEPRLESPYLAERDRPRRLGHDLAAAELGDFQFPPGDRFRVNLSLDGYGAPVSDVTVNASLPGSAEFCGTGSNRTWDVGDLHEDERWTQPFCLTAPNAATPGPQDLVVDVSSTNGLRSSDPPARYTVPILLNESTDPSPISTLRLPNHSDGEWTNRTVLRFDWDPATDDGPDGGTGVRGYSYQYSDKRVRVTNAIHNGTFYGIERSNWTVDFYGDDVPVEAIEGSYEFSVAAVDYSGNRGPVERYRVRIDVSEPYRPEPEATAPAQEGNAVFDYWTNDSTVTVGWTPVADRGPRRASVETYDYAFGLRSAKRPFRMIDVYADGFYDQDARAHRLELNASEPGAHVLTLKPRDGAGNANETTIVVCMQASRATCGSRLGVPRASDVPTLDVNGSLDLDRPGLDRLVQRNLQRVQDRPLPGWLVGDRINLAVSEDGTTEHYLVRLSGGEVVELRPVDGPRDGNPSTRVVTDATTLSRVASADAPAVALDQAYRDGDVTVHGVGIVNALKLTVVKLLLDVRNLVGLRVGPALALSVLPFALVGRGHRRERP